VQVALGRYARCTVRVAAEYPAPDAAQLEPLVDARPSPVQPSEFYRDRWMFHGPQYQGVVGLGPIAENGMDGVLRALPAPGALLDNAGQLMGFWVLVHTSEDRFAFPFQIERIERFGAEPPAGTRVQCALRIDSLAESSARARLELRVQGRLLARVRGWEDRRFETTERSWDVFMRPESALLAEPGQGPYLVVRRHWRSAAGRELVMRRYLGAQEREEYARVALNQQNEWLLERIAAKDAVRRWLFERERGPVYPQQVQVRAGSAGALLASGPFREDLQVAVAHERGIAVALVCVGRAARIQIGALAEGSAEAAAQRAGAGMAGMEWRLEEDFVVRWTAAGIG
jgi:hypothetical protein